MKFVVNLSILSVYFHATEFVDTFLDSDYIARKIMLIYGTGYGLMAHPSDTTVAVVSDAIIDQIVQKIVDQINPVQVILFGSYARGMPATNSDLDLFVVVESNLPRHKRSAKIRLLFSPAPCPLDILVYTPQEVESCSGVVNHIVTHVMTTGKILYERSPDRVCTPMA